MSDEKMPSAEELLASLTLPQRRDVVSRKYPINPFLNIQEVALPETSFLVSVQVGRFDSKWAVRLDLPEVARERAAHFDVSLWLWAIIDPNNAMCLRDIVLVMPGLPVTNQLLNQYVGAVHTDRLNLHVFDTGVERELRE